MTIRQRHYRYRTDSGTADGTPTWADAEDVTAYPSDANFRLRVSLSNDAATATTSNPYELYVSKNGGAYAPITTSSTDGVQSVDAGSSADETSVFIQRLTGLDRPAWIYENSSIDLDFANSRYYGVTAFTDALSCSRASTGYAQTVAGTLTSFGTDTLRITDKGLLVEDARTNTCTKSQEFDHVNWTKLTSTITADAAVAPDGTTTADKFLSSNGSLQNTGVYQSSSTTGTTTWSAFCKAAEFNYGCLIAIDSSGNRHAIVVDLTTGTITATNSTGSPTVVSTSTESFASGWWRLAITLSGSDGSIIGVSDSHTSIPTFTNSFPNVTANGSQGIYIWGAQQEAGAFASSYIPTTTVAVTRAADNITAIGNLNTVFSALPQSIVVDAILNAVPTAALRFVGVNSGITALYARLNNTTVAVFNGSVELLATLGGSLTWTGGVKSGSAQATAQRSVVGGGGTVATDTNIGAIMASATVGSDGSGSNFIYGYIRRLTVWNSKLADATLQALTAP